MLRIGIVAGEASGDYLGANLIRDLRRKNPDLVVEGIGGPQLEQQGCRLIFSIEKFSVMGFIEVLGKYLELARARSRLTEYFIQHPPDIFIGVDAPDFNLDLEKKLRNHQIKTVHYVSPQVWAWREYRLRKIAQAVDVLLALFPFEKDYYEAHNIPVVNVGHPLADEIGLAPDRAAARARLGLPAEKRVIALMPGSRQMELDRLMGPFLLTADWCMRQRSDLHFTGSLLTDGAKQQFESTVSRLCLDHLPLSLYVGRAHDVLEAADVVLLASGTITLEAMLYKRPMVVAYKMHWLTYALLKWLVKVKHAALPNLLAGSDIVPECLQAECRPERLGHEIMRWLHDGKAVAAVEREFAKLHERLRSDASGTAADAVLSLLGKT
ncbi:MAG: lipid-A-disaccharide synthase [Gammaproteobacteria bacterium]